MRGVGEMDENETTLKTKSQRRSGRREREGEEGRKRKKRERLLEPPYKSAMLQLTYSPSVHNTFMAAIWRWKGRGRGQAGE